MKKQKEGTQPVGAAEGGRRPTGAASTGRGERGRFNSARKMEAFLAAGQAGLKSREPDPRDEENARLKQLLGDREMRLEIHRQAAKLRGYELPFDLGKRK